MADFFNRLGRALGKFWEEINDPETPEPGPTHGIEETEPNFPHDTTNYSILEDHGLDDKSDFPKSWRAPQFKLWEREPQTYKPFYDEYPSQWKDLIKSFDTGWVQKGVDPDRREAARETFYDQAGMTKSSFDWKAYRAYLAEVGS